MQYFWLAIGLLVLLALAMAGAWAAQRATGNSGWVDAVWTFATGIAGALGALASGGPWARRLLLAALVLLWAARLGLYIVRRTTAIAHEDARYARFRREWGHAFERRMFGLLMIQAVVAWLLALCVMIAAANPHGLAATPGFTLAGLVIFAIAVAGEALADAQMHAFRANPENRGKVCQRGLWAVSRHPNYFFEWLIWLTYPVIAFGGFWWPGLLALVGPVFMYWLLAKISGIPPLEREMVESRGDAYRDYQARVSPMIPLPPRRRAASERNAAP